MKRLVTALIGFWLALLIMCPGFCETTVEQDFGLALGKPAVPAVKAPAPVKKAVKKPAPHEATKKAGKVRRPASKPVAAKAVAKKAPVPAPMPVVVSAPKPAPVTATVQKPMVPTAPAPQPKVAAQSAPAPAVPTSTATPLPAKPREDKIALLLKQADEQKPAAQSAGDWAKTGLRTIISLAFVLGLAYITILALKRFSDKRDSRPRSSQKMEIVDTLKLGTNSSIHLVNIRGKTLLLGSTAGQINVLTELEADEPAEDPQADKRFAEYLDKYYNDGKYAGPATRMAGLLRDAAEHLRSRQPNVAAKLDAGDSDES